MPDLAKLRQCLGAPGLERLVARMRSRLESGTALDGGPIRITNPSDVERRALDALFGRPPSSGSSISIDLAALSSLLRDANIAEDLETAVELLTGPISNQRARRQAEREQWADLHAQLDSAFGRRPELAALAEELRANGLLRRAARGSLPHARRLCDQLRRLADALPANNAPLPELAAAVTSDAHGLDPDATLGSLGIRLAAHLCGASSWRDAEERREVWASVGVLCDELSAPVLVLNLPARATGVTGEVLAVCSGAGEPCRVTLRQLLRSPPDYVEHAARTAFVCENPTVVACAADRLGRRTAPLVCTDGQPTTAVRVLLRQLAEAGFALRYHGDFDWPGLTIAAFVLRRFGAQPWRMSATDYRAAPAGPRLEGERVTAPWDPELAPAMEVRGVAVHEEHVLDVLLGDLSLDSGATA